ncbi:MULTISPECIES: hydroxymethylglutaryl-CoA lyase [unclassified Pseudomonas]|uniref:hydroxymethylglutaryl-CoA lyase n=1 Tax=unclassified Pseudomonas TaxID=196821 RepID=UPI0021C91F36|nr:MULTISPECIES: hydroxymethylglutaryl-CoA lyase [unclassified Pseudomonas]MCU1732659.1 hydroxymethylglutaryl-CoA lyase [Pseudomonas sp. 20P_3.2_Bac4]MCU1744009.1 hydroxymethylglutaryl-CoA lyase [Pseudomonas sp. 20P_3.2_Bac5]
MATSERVKIVEMAARDGLQNEPRHLSVEARLRLIRDLAATGLRHIEGGAFVSPRWVPQMAGAEELFRQLPRDDGVNYSALVPNLQGLEAALRAGCREVAVFAAASEAFSRSNINCSIDESFERFAPVLRAAREAGVRVRGYVSCVLGCPFSGPVATDAVVRVASRLYQMGCHEISLGDTIGAGRPDETARLIEHCARALPITALAGHFHDTYGMAIANIHAALSLGMRTFDSSVAGLGGCPYSPGASGNVATEDVLYLLHGMGFETGIDLEAMARVGARISAELGQPSRSRVGLALAARDARQP